MTAAYGESKSDYSDHDELSADLHPLVKIDDAGDGWLRCLKLSLACG